ncbi:hypothetical protein SDC9_80920 [bioreactor metagenome]|uniref:Uncharacterized protein n=1 Tax=bioreactor metagenome TaxID=1076179 RepID=A0A644Z226_9ZZZZ
MEELSPSHNDAGEATADNVRLVLIATLTVAVPLHPAEVVPVTEYVVVEVGLTVIGLVVSVVLHAYVSAPLPVRLVAEPIQIVGDAATAVTAGFGLTVTVTVVVPVQPAPVVPVTEYVVVVAGETESGFVVEPESQI